MKSPEAAIRDVIISAETPLGSRIYPVIAPANVTLPFAVFRRASIRREATFTGPLGNPIVRLEYMVMDKTYESVRQVADTLRLAIDGWTGMVNDILIRQTYLDNEYDNYAQLQGAEMPSVYTVVQSYDLIWEEIKHG